MTISRGVLAVALALALLGAPCFGQAQPPERTVRVGFLVPASPSEDVEGFLAGMRDLGYIEGRNLVVPPALLGRADRIIE